VDLPTFGRPTIATICDDISFADWKVRMEIYTEKERRYLVFSSLRVEISIQTLLIPDWNQFT